MVALICVKFTGMAPLTGAVTVNEVDPQAQFEALAAS
jgi:hypothetical protein